MAVGPNLSIFSSKPTLSRARVVAGDGRLRTDVEDEFRAVLTKPRDAEELRRDVMDMRRRMLEELYGGDPWDIKQKPGGLVEVEFVAQYLQLKHAWETPEILRSNVRAALKQLRLQGYLEAAQGERLADAYELYQTLTQLLRLSASGAFAPETASIDLKDLMVSAAGEPDFAHLEDRLEATALTVRSIFEQVIGPISSED